MRHIRVAVLLLVSIACIGLAPTAPAVGLDTDVENPFVTLISDIVTYAPPVYVQPFTAKAERARTLFTATETVPFDPAKVDHELGALRRQIEAVTGTNGLTIDEARVLLRDVVRVRDLLPRVAVSACSSFDHLVELSGRRLNPNTFYVVVVSLYGKFFDGAVAPTFEDGSFTVLFRTTVVNGQLAVISSSGEIVPVNFPLPVSVVIFGGGSAVFSATFVLKTIPCPEQSFVLNTN